MRPKEHCEVMRFAMASAAPRLRRPLRPILARGMDVSASSPPGREQEEVLGRGGFGLAWVAIASWLALRSDRIAITSLGGFDYARVRGLGDMRASRSDHRPMPRASGFVDIRPIKMKRARRRRGNQGELPLKFWGGWRKRPKPSGPERIKHRRRASLYSEHPVHVTLRAVPEVGSLRAKARYAIILKTIRQTAAEKKDFAIVHFSVQGNHLHLIVEAVDARALGRGMQRLNIRIGVRLNRLLHRKGRVFRDRYFRKDLASPKQTRFCIAYVLQNFRKHENEHGRRCPRGWLDPCSSSPWFESWSREPVTPKPNDSPPVASPRTWFLRQGWLAHGPISPDEIPGYQW